MADYDAEQLGFLDEVSKDQRTTQRKNGRTKKGHRACMRGVFICGVHLSAEGLLTTDGMMATAVVKGSMTRNLFLEYLEKEVVRDKHIYLLTYSLSYTQLPLTSPFPGKLSVLVMDNAKIHHREDILELVEPYGNTYILIYLFAFLLTAISGVRIVFLPPYSPDFNPIEEAFSKIKHFIHCNGHLMTAENNDLNGLIYDMYICMDVITADDARGYIRHAGYM